MFYDIKKAFKEATNDEEKKKVAQNYKDELNKLSDEELSDVTGGRGRRSPNGVVLITTNSPSARKSI